MTTLKSLLTVMDPEQITLISITRKPGVYMIKPYICLKEVANIRLLLCPVSGLTIKSDGVPVITVNTDDLSDIALQIICTDLEYMEAWEDIFL